MFIVTAVLSMSAVKFHLSLGWVFSLNHTNSLDLDTENLACLLRNKMTWLFGQCNMRNSLFPICDIRGRQTTILLQNNYFIKLGGLYGVQPHFWLLPYLTHYTADRANITRACVLQFVR